jgi:hypothetical protein
MECPYCGKELVAGKEECFETLAEHVECRWNYENPPMRPTLVCRDRCAGKESFYETWFGECFDNDEGKDLRAISHKFINELHPTNVEFFSSIRDGNKFYFPKLIEALYLAGATHSEIMERIEMDPLDFPTYWQQKKTVTNSQIEALKNMLKEKKND